MICDEISLSFFRKKLVKLWTCFKLDKTDQKDQTILFTGWFYRSTVIYGRWHTHLQQSSVWYALWDASHSCGKGWSRWPLSYTHGQVVIALSLHCLLLGLALHDRMNVYMEVLSIANGSTKTKMARSRVVSQEGVISSLVSSLVSFLGLAPLVSFT
jgi:hypothetical protein